MPRVEYLACTHCGSEYLVQRKGRAVGLEPFAPEQYDLSKQISDVERSQSEGCSNVFFWILLVAFIFFCVLGLMGRSLFQNSNILLIVGWVISILALTLAAIVLLRNLNASRYKRLELEARRRELYAKEQAANPVEESPDQP